MCEERVLQLGVAKCGAVNVNTDEEGRENESKNWGSYIRPLLGKHRLKDKNHVLLLFRAYIGDKFSLSTVAQCSILNPDLRVSILRLRRQVRRAASDMGKRGTNKRFAYEKSDRMIMIDIAI